jgi:two-component system, NarL family, response regulator NreC
VHPQHAPMQQNKIASRKNIRCLPVHEDLALRTNLRNFLEGQPDFEVVGEARNAAECVRKIISARPDVIIADSVTFGLSLCEAELLVRRECPNTKLLFLTVRSNFTLQSVETRMRSSSRQQTSLEELVSMIRNVCGDRTGFAEAAPVETSRGDFPPQPRQRALTAREHEVLKLLAEGNTVRAAASTLGLSSKTVDVHKFNLMRKLGIHNKAQLVMWAVRKRVVDIPISRY